MIYILSAFIFGIFVPYASRRFAKFMPATFAGALVELFRLEKKGKSYRKTPFYKKFLWRSVLYGFVSAGITWFAIFHFGTLGLGCLCAYLWLLLLLAEIDYRTFLLPDILTVPLLLLGLLTASLNVGLITIEESVLGAVVGYALPVVVSLLIVWRNKEAFGGGDIKLLSAIGAWLGVEGLIYVIALSSVLGLCYAFVMRQRSLAFGPMIALSGIIIAFCLF